MGYGTDGKFRFDDAPPGLLFLLDGYKKEIKTIKEKKLQADENISKKWEQYSSNDYLSLKSYTIDTWLLGTNWRQDSPYNNSCPEDPQTRLLCKVGCGSVALGQILNYWNCRVFPDGTNTYTPPGFLNALTVNFYGQNYHWDNMDVSDVANLLYHCGVAIEANYSSSQTSNSQGPVVTALGTFFGFATDGIKWKDSNQSAWINMLKYDIDAQRPIYYVGMDPLVSKGHAWVVDGYNSNNEFHCNWGWGPGWDGFFPLTYLHLDTYTFTNDQGAILGIQPVLDACSGLSGNDLVCSSNSTYSVTIPTTASIQWSKGANLTEVGASNTSNYTVHATSLVNGAISSVTATIKNSQGQTFLTRSKEVVAGSPKPGTVSIEMDAPIHRFTASISTVPLATSYNWYMGGVLNNTYHDTFAIFNRVSPYCGGSYYVQVEAVNTCSPSSKTSKTVIEPDCSYFLAISPNPTSNESTIELVSENVSAIEANTEWDLEVFDQNQTLKAKKTKNKGQICKLNTQGWNDGVYIIRANYSGILITEKLVVKH